MSCLRRLLTKATRRSKLSECSVGSSKHIDSCCRDVINGTEVGGKEPSTINILSTRANKGRTGTATCKIHIKYPFSIIFFFISLNSWIKSGFTIDKHIFIMRSTILFHDKHYNKKTDDMMLTWWGYELVIIVIQLNIKVEILDVNIRSELLVILSTEPSDNELQPKAGGGSFPGGISKLTTSLLFDESTKTFKWIIFIIFKYYNSFISHTFLLRLYLTYSSCLPSPMPWKASLKWLSIDNKIFCISKDQLSSSPFDFGSDARQCASF